jgi:hypothetical protein
MQYIPSQTNHTSVAFKMKKRNWKFITDYQIKIAASPSTWMSFTSTANSQAVAINWDD